MTTTLLVRPARPLGTVALSRDLDRRPRPRATTAQPAAETPHPAPTPTRTASLELAADLPFHVLVAAAQDAERAGRDVLWLTGGGAAAVASRLLRLTRTLAIGAELDLSRGAEAAALDAVALTRIGDARAHVLVRDARQLPALARELGLRPRARATRFGGDAFAATLPPAESQDVRITAVVDYDGDLVTVLPLVRAILVVAPSGVDAHALVRRARAAGAGWPDVVVHVAVPADQRPAGWPHADGLVLGPPAERRAA
ncbi:hypothetical protein C8046_14025 [Serinibacter arcticus]|uniref:Uncharacterized protein n=1 Tax=Serinibacter arcticus TaxID=1655435 RepID=A0A2U1ZXC2_9MICO|nr:hypothetical protein [Serinibacter arcticus]PWD51593.1 hypothetical protein C8046_14025 [Serinibacter arcticus]